MRFTRILLITLILAASAIAVSAQTDASPPPSPQTETSTQAPQAPPSQSQTDTTAQPSAPEAQPPAPQIDPASEDAVPPKVFAPDVVIFGEPQADFVQHMQPILFDLDVSDHPVNQDALNADAQYLKDHPQVRFWVNGYADIRGDTLYNVNLAQRRAETVRNALVSMGIPQERILMDVGWGKLYPICGEQDEPCFEKNRRVHLVYVP